jgi:hypothetical protein
LAVAVRVLIINEAQQGREKPTTRRHPDEGLGREATRGRKSIARKKKKR